MVLETSPEKREGIMDEMKEILTPMAQKYVFFFFFFSKADYGHALKLDALMWSFWNETDRKNYD